MHILDFITSLDVFASQIIDEIELQEAEMDLEGVINLKTKTIPRGMVQLERTFDLYKVKDQEWDAKKESISGQCEKYNMGTHEDVRNVFIGKVCTLEERKQITDALHTYQDVIAWSYEDLKTYDTSIITHTIPLNLGVRPFRKR